MEPAEDFCGKYSLSLNLGSDGASPYQPIEIFLVG
jgi:hypothetical protein